MKISFCHSLKESLRIVGIIAFLGTLAVVGCQKTEDLNAPNIESSVNSDSGIEETTIEEYEYEPEQNTEYNEEGYVPITDISGEKYQTQDDCQSSKFKDYFVINNVNTFASPTKYITIKLPQKDAIISNTVARSTKNVQFEYVTAAHNTTNVDCSLRPVNEDSLTYTFALEIPIGGVKSGNTLWGKNCTYGDAIIYAIGKKAKYSIKVKCIENNLFGGIATTNKHGLLINKYTYPTDDSPTDTITIQKLKSQKQKTAINISSTGESDYVPQKWDIICFGETNNKRGFVSSDVTITPATGSKKRKFEFEYCITNASCTNAFKIKKVKVYENKLTLLKCNTTDNLKYFIR